MKPETVKYVVISILAVSILVVFYRGNSALREVRLMREKLEITSDSLRIISSQYKDLTTEYQKIYSNLETATQGVRSMKEKLELITQRNVTNTSAIRDELRGIIGAYDSLDFSFEADTTNIDNLKF